MSVIQLKGTKYSPITMGIGSRYVHMAQVKDTGERVSICAAESAPIQTHFERDEAVRRAIRSCLNAGRFKGRKAAICLKGDNIFVQHQRLPKEGKGAVEKRIREEFQRDLPFDVDRAEVRFINTGRVYERSEVFDELILMVADRDVIHWHLTVLEDLNLTPVMIGVEPLGLLRTFLQFPPLNLPPQGVTAFMNIAASKAELIVIRNDTLGFTRSLPMGGEEFTQAIASKLEIEPADAERLKRAISTKESLNDTLRSAALAAFRPVFEAMCSEILSCFRYFSSIFNRETVDRLIVAGEEVGGIVELKSMEAQIGVPVLSWDAGAMFGDRDDLMTLRGEASSFAPVIGLAIEAMNPSDPVVDFIPREVAEKHRRKKSATMRISSLGLLLLVMGLLYFITFNRRAKLDQMRNLVQSRNNQIELKNVVVDSLNDEEDALEFKRFLLRKARPQIRISRILGEIARVAGEGISFQKLEVRCARPQKRAGEENKLEEYLKYGSPNYVISIEGLACALSDLSSFLTALERSRAFATIEEGGSEDMHMENMHLKSFSLTLTVNGEADDEVF